MCVQLVTRVTTETGSVVVEGLAEGVGPLAYLIVGVKVKSKVALKAAHSVGSFAVGVRQRADQTETVL